ncbi:alpha/beta fold hydrolase [Mycolicibacterium fluoranthenivorans]|uniref:Pimeloyl-ACP methyl ester carboxylesterase n=1 Tax=Mycolicibacterium fluoranthenivorans TaxID=258505 RepID=A0A7X5ZC05_9MYCO|nr:alpha/beta hydrolase [Mycolicibacterium fluoranthenivorans]MCV7355630.1 alpha/beta hydrolase [Mycolicibacterium fluoranthenivorans]NIH94619.1 pimeloyl-ACP methyl ester carboxylesterase [Mycolicibacterium fluoranthenivorans]
MTERTPIHLGSGEPILMLHPFLCSQNVWRTVATRLAGTGRFEVLAPTMVGHRGGRRAPSWLLDTVALVDDIERRMDEIGWRTAHIVGNSLGGWVAFELERRGRSRTLTAIAPAGGWSQHSPGKYETVLKFILGGPALLAARLLGPRILELPFVQRIATLPVSGPADGPSRPDMVALLEDATHCTAYFQLLLKTLRLPGLLELADVGVPTHLVLCEKDRVFPTPRGHRYFLDNLPRDTRVTRLPGYGHIPMLEAPGHVTELIADFVDAHTEPERAASPAG